MTCRREREKEGELPQTERYTEERGTTQSKKEEKEDGGIRASPAHLLQLARILIVLRFFFEKICAETNTFLEKEKIKHFYFPGSGRETRVLGEFSCFSLPPNQVVSSLKTSILLQSGCAFFLIFHVFKLLT